MSVKQSSVTHPVIGAWLTAAALIALIAVAIAVVYTKHESRRLFIQLQELSRDRDALNAEWSRLQLEESTYSANNRIEKAANGPLALKRPEASEVFLITDQGDFRFVGLEPVSEELAALLADGAPTLSDTP